MPLKTLYILGTRGIPAAHGGFETFAEGLAVYMARQDWQVIVYCQGDTNGDDMWQGIRRIHLKAPDTTLGTAWFDLKAILHCLRQPNGIWLTLGYNTGLLNFIPKLFGKKQIINMDGIEWRRGKWSWPYKAMFYFNYLCAGLAGDILIADNPGIKDILRMNFKADKIKMIPYGARQIIEADTTLLEPYTLKPREYGLMIARVEPENNILELVQAWSLKKRHKKLVVLGRFDSTNRYHMAIRQSASAEVIFPGAIYDKAVVDALRYHAHVYLHGHSVGGTNPSLVEALGAGNAIIANDNVFNRWTARDAAEYFKTQEQLEEILDRFDPVALRHLSVQRHQEAFEEHQVLEQYRQLIEAL